MPSDNHISSILLLILIGLAIYFLFNSNKGLTAENFENEASNEIDDGETDNENTNDNFNDVEGDNANDPDTNIYDVPASLTAPINIPETVTSYQSDQPSQVDQIENQINKKNKQIRIAEQDNTEDNVRELQPPKLQTNINYNIPESSYQVPNSKDLNNFTPNDEESFNYAGTSLTDAFAAPLPPGANSDVIDFKKGNMDNYDAKDFLPKEVNDEWFETDFSLAKYQLNDDKLINTERYIIGINTVGQSLKNATYDIRGTIPNHKFSVSPWGNSTMEPDFNIKPLC
jgi:hypothetical protein